jgi:long-chain acyl-CoA synthetase
VLQRLKEDVGLQRAKMLISSGEPMDRAVVEAFSSMDLWVNEVYGTTESTGVSSLGTAESMKLGACGRPLLGVEVKIAQGEVLLRGPNVCLGYFEGGKATSALAKDGWLHTGDAGQLDPDGFLRVAGRLDDLMATTGAKKVAPAAIEWMLRRLAPVQDAVVMRAQSGALGAVVTLDSYRAPTFARERGWPTEPGQLSEHRAFLEDLQRRIDAEVNVRLSRWEAIRGVIVLPDALSVEAGDLTAMLQLKRRELQRRHGPAVNALFAAERATR